MDTTGHLIAASLYVLARQPKYFDRLREEVLKVAGRLLERGSSLEDKKAALRETVYFDMFLNEVLRIYGPLKNILFRGVDESFELGGLSLRRKECFINMQIGMNMLNPKYFPEPGQFKPERWESPTVAMHAFMPFSSGPRNCIGQHMSKVEAKVTLALVLRDYLLESVGKEIRYALDGLYTPTDDRLALLRARG